MSKRVGDREEAKRGCGLAGYYKFSHKHIKPTHTGNLLIDAHNMTHLSGFPNFPNSDRTLLCFHRPTHPTEATLGVLFLILSKPQLIMGNSKSRSTGPTQLILITWYRYRGGCLSQKGISAPVPVQLILVTMHQ